MSTKYNVILLFGAPGSGKGTQGKVLGHLPGYIHVSSGDLFRALDRQSELGKVFVEYSSKGKLVPDDFTIRLWKDHVDKMAAAGKFHPDTDVLVLDGIPRNVHQSEMLDEHVSVQKVIVLRAIHNRAAMVQRLKARALKEGRLDDANEDTIRNRMEVYDRESRPVLARYSNEVRVDVDSLQTPIEVAHDILSGVLGRRHEVKTMPPPPPPAAAAR